MNIPLDRLYHYIDNIAKEIYGNRVIIYRFWPHGSKNITDLNSLYESTWYSYATSPAIWCNDQEPLDHKFYSNHVKIFNGTWMSILKSINLYRTPKNLNYRPDMFEK